MLKMLNKLKINQNHHSDVLGPSNKKLVSELLQMPMAIIIKIKYERQ